MAPRGLRPGMALAEGALEAQGRPHAVWDRSFPGLFAPAQEGGPGDGHLGLGRWPVCLRPHGLRPRRLGPMVVGIRAFDNEAFCPFSAAFRGPRPR